MALVPVGFYDAFMKVGHKRVQSRGQEDRDTIAAEEVRVRAIDLKPHQVQLL